MLLTGRQQKQVERLHEIYCSKIHPKQRYTREPCILPWVIEWIRYRRTFLLSSASEPPSLPPQLPIPRETL